MVLSAPHSNRIAEKPEFDGVSHALLEYYVKLLPENIAVHVYV